MVINSTDLAGLIETVAHEWIHNYLTFKPLGIRYEFSSELRTMNETTASIAGKEISRAVMQRFDSSIDNRRNPLYDTVAIDFYPGLKYHNQPFDFQTEMYQTRLRVDELLSDGKIDMIIHDAPIILMLAAENERQGLVPLSSLLTEEYLAWGLRKTEVELLKSANTFLEAIREDGRLDSIVDRWIPFSK